MEDFLTHIYRFFKRKQIVFWIVFISTIGVLAWSAVKINIEENITKFFPDDKRVKKLNTLFENSSFSERIVVMVSVKDSSQISLPDSLVATTESLVEQMEDQLRSSKATVNSKIEEDKMLQLLNTTLQFLPIFLTPEDYHALDSITQPDVAKQVLNRQYRQLISPSGLALKNIIVNDPMGFSYLVLKKLQHLQYDDNFELYDNYIITRDHRHLIFFIQSGYGANQTAENMGLVTYLEDIAKGRNEKNDAILISYFGAPVVAVGNARQIKHDTILTLSLFVALLTTFMLLYFRDIRVMFLILVPVIFGALFALFFIYLIKGSVSILALAAGSIILGIAVNYALHFLVHQRNHQNIEEVIKDIAKPMTIGSLTTVLAFFSLQFTHAPVLKDIGLFAGFSLIGAALCTLIFLPHLSPQVTYKETTIERLSFLKKSSSGFWVVVILMLTPVFFYFAQDVSFNTDMSKLNFMNNETHEAQHRLETINPASLHTLYVTSDATTLEGALRENEKLVPYIDSLQKEGIIKQQHSLSEFLLSDSLQQVRINQWKQFWTDEKKEPFLAAIKEEGARLKFSSVVLANVDSVIEKKYDVLDTASFNTIRNAFFQYNIIEKENETTIVSLINVLPEGKERVHAALSATPAHVLDRQTITNIFVEFVHSDFNFIVAFTSILVFVVLLISTGRIEITFITFLPMLITWIWVLGIMALLHIEFNIVNVMISTFIFGLGDDYSIFVMDGLVQEYKTGKESLQSVRTSIFLSMVTTISGLGVLIFAEHPALRSIAAIAIIGVVCVFLMSQTIEPYLFKLLITNRTKRGIGPMTFRGMMITLADYTLFVGGSFFLTLFGLILSRVPFQKQKIRWLLHFMISFFTKLIIDVAVNLKKKTINLNPDFFKRPGVIICNHTSFLDILFTTALSPKLILLTNKWVWNSPVFGGVVRLVEYYPVTEGVEYSVEKLKRPIKNGYSILAFPEGTRSPDGKIGRFHKGAFYIAEKLQLPVYPLLILGANEGIPKSTMYVNDAHVTLKMLPPIEVDDTRFGESYSERTKKISRYFKEEYARLDEEENTPQSTKIKLLNNYRYKGPVLEWYMRIKLRIENYYEVFDQLVPKQATVLDLGCGYGFLCYTLQFLSKGRTITGVDYDTDKIAVADNGYLKSERLTFHTADVTDFDFSTQDVIIISDVLHYLKEAQQEQLLTKCFHSLSAGGKIIVRDGNADLKVKHKGTRVTEFFSVKLLKFNKSQNELNFISVQAITEFARKNGFEVKVIAQGKLTSNVIFVISKQV